MKALLSVMAIALVAAIGCDQAMTDARVEARKQWNTVRAEAVCKDAAEHLRVGELPQAMTKAAEALELDEDYHQARIVLAKVYIEQGRFKSAAEEAGKVLSSRPDSADAMFLLAVALEKSGKLVQALREYSRAYELDKSNFSAVLASAEVLVALERIDEAAALLVREMKYADNDPAAYELAGRLAMMRQRHKDAARYYCQASDLVPASQRYLEALAEAQVMAGMVAEAIATLERRCANVAKPAPAWCYTMLGDCYLIAGQPAEAATTYDKLCQIRPADPMSWLGLAKSELAAGEPGRAISAASRVLRLQETNVDAICVLGYGLCQTGQVEQAVALLTAAEEAHPEHATLKCVLGRALAAAGKADEAKARYDEAVKLEPQGQLAWALLHDMNE